mmetsp:Transcript_4886/g.12414  ORF Transcript_4886/g.12414 Transcript_4886/m.12414 type:complete len:135 (+) Transcript_4886:1160-1564(+)
MLFCVDDDEPTAYSGPIIFATVLGSVLLDSQNVFIRVGFLSFGKAKSTEFIIINIDIFGLLLVGCCELDRDRDRDRVDADNVQREKIVFLSDTSIYVLVLIFMLLFGRYEDGFVFYDLKNGCNLTYQVLLLLLL